MSNSPRKLARTYALEKEDPLVLMWARKGVVSQNWGDKLNPVLVSWISGKNVVHAHDIFGYEKRDVYFVIGSSLEHAQRTGGIVWGVGFINSEQGLRKHPSEIHAVRGYRSIERLRELGLSPPEIVGDPALLIPRYYQPKRSNKRYELGFIPHCFELDLPVVAELSARDDIKVIDITGDLFKVVDEINSCEFISSSSLHGLICADAYGVPSRWMELSDRPVGDGFKFHDYYSSIGKCSDGPVRVRSAADLSSLQKNVDDSPAKIDLEALLEACPFHPNNLD